MCVSFFGDVKGFYLFDSPRTLKIYIDNIKMRYRLTLSTLVNYVVICNGLLHTEG